MARPRPLALVAAVVAAGSLAYAALTFGPGAGPFEAIPADSFVAATVDVAALRASPLYAILFDKDRTWGLGDLALACGFDPLSRIDELDVAIPEGGDSGDFGVAANAHVTREELVRCAENVAGARGETRKVEEIGRFHFVTDDKGHALAVRDTGPIVVGRASFVRAMIDAAEHRAPNVRTSRAHMELRDALSPSGTRPLVVVTALLPKELRDRLKREMGAELGVPGSNAPMGGVLGVSSAGLSLRETDTGMLEARAELRCDAASACEEVRKLALAKRLSLSQDIGLRFIGLGPVIDAFDAQANGTSLTATTRARASDLASSVERILKLKGQDARPAPRPPPPPAPTRASRPDEVLFARDGGPRDGSK